MVQEPHNRRWVLPVFVFVGIQCYFIFSQITGPFYDEAINVVAGLRTLQGYGVSDEYLTWIDGFHLWPVLASLGYLAYGLVGTRLIALVMSTVAMIFCVRAAGMLFGEAASFWTGIAMVTSAPFFALGHFAVHDLPALASVALSLWATLRFVKTDNRKWLILAALALAIATLSKYPIVIMALPIAWIIKNTRGERALKDLAILALLGGVVGLVYFLSFRDQLIRWLQYGVSGGIWPETRLMIFYRIILFGLVPIGLSFVGYGLAGGFRDIASPLMVASLMWPIIHIITANSLSLSKHIVFGFLFAYPLCGLVFARLWSSQAWRIAVPVMIAGLGCLAIYQETFLEFYWPDVRPGVDYLSNRVQSGQKLLINEGWPYAMDLYVRGKLASPWDVTDTFGLDPKKQPSEFCRFDWFVDEEGFYPWPNQVKPSISQCGTFQSVFTFSRPTIYLGTDIRSLGVLSNTIRTTVWKNLTQK